MEKSTLFKTKELNSTDYKNLILRLSFQTFKQPRKNLPEENKSQNQPFPYSSQICDTDSCIINKGYCYHMKIKNIINLMWKEQKI